MKALDFLGALVLLAISTPFYALGIFAGAAVGALEFAFKKARATWTDYGARAAVVLLLPTCLLGGCLTDQEESWKAETPSVVYEANGFTFGFYGPRDTGYAPDVSPSLDARLVTLEEIGGALEARALELAGRTGLEPSAAVAMLRGCRIWVVDDYNFSVGDMWASGQVIGSTVYVALWARQEVALEAQIPAEAPGWTIRPPDRENVNWRYGGRSRFVPAADHELGHVFFGPYFEH